MKQKACIYGIIALSFFKSNYKRQKRVISALVSVLLAMGVGSLFLHNIPSLLQFDIGEKEQFYIEAQEGLYFVSQVTQENLLIYPYYQNEAYFFETHLFDYEIQISFHQFFNYNGPFEPALLSNQIQLGGKQLLLQEISQVVEKEFTTAQELDAYLAMMPLPLHLYLHESHLLLWITGFLWLEEEIMVIPPYPNWGQEILQQANCQVVDDYRLAAVPYIKKSYSIQKKNILAAQLKSDQLLLCQEQHCIIQQANAFLFHPRQVAGIEQGYIYTPLNPYVSGVVYQQQDFVLQNMSFNQQALEVLFNLDTRLTNEQEIAISAGLASYLGLQLKESITLQGKGNQKTYRVVEIRAENQFVIYKDSLWTLQDCLYLSAADPQEFLANYIFLTDLALTRQASLLDKPVQSSHALLQQEIEQALHFIRLGIFVFVFISVLLSCSFLILLLLFDTKELHQQFQLLYLYGYKHWQMAFILILARLLSYGIACIFSVCLGSIAIAGLHYLSSTIPIFGALINTLPLKDMLFIGCGVSVLLVFVTILVFWWLRHPKKTIKGRKHDFY